jgi:hypothetical protein
MTPLSYAKIAIKEHPAKITATEFLEMIKENPSVFEHWDTPLEITEYVNCQNSPITHLSKYLTFSGDKETGDAASFLNCSHLKVATGTFHGYVGIQNSGIQSIENLTVTKPNNDGNAARFANCHNLKVATGTYLGSVSFHESGIENIENLTVTKANTWGVAAYLSDCPNLKVATGTYPGFVCFQKSGIQQIKELTITNPNKDGDYARFTKCRNLQTLKGWDLSKQIKIEPEKLAAEKERRALQKFQKETGPTSLPFL